MRHLRGKDWLAFLACVLLLLAIGWLDYVTGYELGLFIFYSLPVGLVAWRLGRWPGILIGVAAGLIWLLADVAAGDKFSSPFFLYWNAGLHMGGFLINALTLAKIKATLDRQQRLVEDLARAREEIRRLSNANSTPVTKEFLDVVSGER